MTSRTRRYNDVTFDKCNDYKKVKEICVISQCPDTYELHAPHPKQRFIESCEVSLYWSNCRIDMIVIHVIHITYVQMTQC